MSMNSIIRTFSYIIAEKDRELATSQGEIKALRVTEALKDKAIEEVFSLSVVNHITYHKQPPYILLMQERGKSVKNNGYILVSANGGLNQQRVASRMLLQPELVLEDASQDHARKTVSCDL
ncbi:microtubule-associated protein 70-5 [Senna tora]|uniref:Microtubule-associated protein 70-5 n=1 Tax=Senna tora TaxID=362788 RepID=A0A834XBZ2_9FABA|nr:microtubule-associated protein 70-5 [Senna tora]